MESRGEIYIKVGYICWVIGGYNMERRGELSTWVCYIYNRVNYW